MEQPRVEMRGFCVSRQNRWLTPCLWGGWPAFLARGACRALDSRAFQMHLSRLVASLTWTHDFGPFSLARLSKVFGFLRFSSPRAVKKSPGAQKGAPNLKPESPDAGRNLAKNQKTSFLRPSKARTCFCPTSNLLYSINFVKTNAPGGLPSSAVWVRIS